MPFRFEELFSPHLVLLQLRQFLEQGGDILLLIMLVTFLLWTLIVERYWYFWCLHRRMKQKVYAIWEQRSDKQSWYAQQVRRRLISRVRVRSEHNLATIQAVVAVAPLLGLLGTVTGMVEVFDVMAFTGSSNTRGMAAGVSKATIPTMAGMVVSLSGLFFIAALKRRVRRELRTVSDQLILGGHK